MKVSVMILLVIFFHRMAKSLYSLVCKLSYCSPALHLHIWIALGGFSIDRVNHYINIQGGFVLL